MGAWKIIGGRKWDGKLCDNTELEIEVSGEQDIEVHLGKEDILLPGLVDFHCHPWAPGAVADSNIADTMLASIGIVACVDGGTFGYEGWQRADLFWKARREMKILSLLNVRPEGFTKIPNPNPSRAEDISVQRITETFQRAEGRILGLKVTLGSALNKEDDLKILEFTRTAADQCKCWIAMHLTKTFLTLEEIEPYLQAKDLLLHPFHGERGNALTAEGLYSDTMFRMQKKGIKMDTAVGRSHLSWKVAKKAFERGFCPDIITSDQVLPSWHKTTLHDLPQILSAFASGMGMTDEDVLRATLSVPLEYMKLKLDYGKNLVVLKKRDGKVLFPDTYGELVEGNFEYIPEIVILDNRVLSAPSGYNE